MFTRNLLSRTFQREEPLDTGDGRVFSLEPLLVFWPLLVPRRRLYFSALRSAVVVWVVWYERYTKNEINLFALCLRQIKRSTGHTHTHTTAEHTTAEQTTHTNTERATAQRVNPTGNGAVRQRMWREALQHNSPPSLGQASCGSVPRECSTLWLTQQGCGNYQELSCSLSPSGTCATPRQQTHFYPKLTYFPCVCGRWSTARASFGS